LPNPTEITRHFDDCSEMRHGAILMMLYVFANDS
jgi:hypothetical protein